VGAKPSVVRGAGDVPSGNVGLEGIVKNWGQEELGSDLEEELGSDLEL
jgi:hypothetical protein